MPNFAALRSARGGLASLRSTSGGRTGLRSASGGGTSLDRLTALHGTAALRTAGPGLTAMPNLAALRSAARGRLAALHGFASLRSASGGRTGLDLFAALHGAAALRTAGPGLTAMPNLAALRSAARGRLAALHGFASLRSASGGRTGLDRLAALDRLTALDRAAALRTAGPRLTALPHTATLRSAARRLASLHLLTSLRGTRSRRTSGRLTTAFAEQTRLHRGDTSHRPQGGYGQCREQDTTQHGRYSFVRKDLKRILTRNCVDCGFPVQSKRCYRLASHRCLATRPRFPMSRTYSILPITLIPCISTSRPCVQVVHYIVAVAEVGGTIAARSHHAVSPAFGGTAQACPTLHLQSRRIDWPHGAGFWWDCASLSHPTRAFRRNHIKQNCCRRGEWHLPAKSARLAECTRPCRKGNILADGKMLKQPGTNGPRNVVDNTKMSRRRCRGPLAPGY